MKWLSDLSAVRDRVKKLLAAGFVEEPEANVLRQKFIQNTTETTLDNWIVGVPKKRRDGKLEEYKNSSN